ncbi:MAG TPA: NAD-dependent succinate-semialdehyde dehydrogenase [Blastocatellia bacterium]|nr:NAD-dependent succinate-semialdehyde dehydrogenase [Blastocatellia bacterium]
MPIASINPATGETIKTYEELSDSRIENKLESAAETFREYRTTTFDERAEKMMRAAAILERYKKQFAETMTTEMGKPIKAAIAEAEKCALVCRYYAENAERFLADEPVETSATRSYVHYQPLGAVLAVMPWNFPFWQVFRFAAPALMAGNVGLLKHASNVPACALAIESIFRDAGFPDGAFQTLLIGSDKVGYVIEDDRIKAVTLTGSEPAGSSVASLAGKLIKKSVLELGGSDPFIVMPSANLDEAVKTAITARTINNGQSCIAAKRFIVAEEIAHEFETRFVAGMEALAVGNPLDDTVDVGPLATAQILEDLGAQVRTTIDLGARVLTGGHRLEQPGYFYLPTVLTDIPKESPAYRDELFGPVASLFRALDIDDAIRIANDTSFGLGASAWTNERKEQTRFIDEIEAGCVFINGMVASDPRLPFGGVKRSGYGRELGGFGIREFVNIKTIWIKAEPGESAPR